MEQTRGLPQRLGSVEELGRERGFAMVPFDTEAEPVVLLRPDKVEVCPLEADEPVAVETVAVDGEGDRSRYGHDFRRFHEALLDGKFQKIVLARRSERLMSEEVGAERLFRHACHLYPHQMVALFSSPLTGTWLMATPEVLLRGDGRRWHTMALAGTMPTDGPWSEKNKEEQAFVATYIEQCLRRRATDIEVSPTYTRTAARLFHLCTDFSFGLPSSRCVGPLLEELFPTPAVCGIPKDRARRFIRQNESAPRSYYSGFLGPIDPLGTTELYVSLRCVRIEGRRLSFFAGGGLLTESQENKEWAETEAKLKTISHVFE